MDKKTVTTLLGDMGKKELLDIIAKLVNYSEQGERWLLKYCKKKGDKSKQSFIVEKQLLSHWRAAEEIIYECNCYGGGPREEGYDELDELYELAKKNVTSWEVRKEIVDGMMEQFRIGNSGFDDSLVDTALVLCKSKEEKLYLADLLNEYGGHYYKDVAADMYWKLGKEEAFLEIQQNNLCYGSDYIKLADYYKKKKNAEKALSIMETALEQAEGRMDEVYTRQKEYLLLMMKYSDRDSVKHWFDVCKQELQTEDFENKQKEIYEQLKKHNLKEYCKVLMDEGKDAEVLDYLNERMPYDNYWALDYEHKISRRLAEKFPQEIISWRVFRAP